MKVRLAAALALLFTLCALPAAAADGRAPVRGQELALELPGSSLLLAGGARVQEGSAFARVGVLLPVRASGLQLRVGPRLAVGLRLLPGGPVAIQGVGAALLLQLERRLTLRADLEASFRPGRPQAGSDFAFGLRLEVATL